jgi:hypothetical protein
LQYYQDHSKSSEELDGQMTFPNAQSPLSLLMAWQQNDLPSCGFILDDQFLPPGDGSWVYRIHQQEDTSKSKHLSIASSVCSGS